MVRTRSSRWYSTGHLLKRLSEEALPLVRQELALARAELVQKGREARMAVGPLGAAAAAGLAALSALTGLLILALALAVDTWQAALIVTVR